MNLEDIRQSGWKEQPAKFTCKGHKKKKATESSTPPVGFRLESIEFFTWFFFCFNTDDIRISKQCITKNKKEKTQHLASLMAYCCWRYLTSFKKRNRFKVNSSGLNEWTDRSSSDDDFEVLRVHTNSQVNSRGQEIGLTGVVLLSDPKRNGHCSM
jgi:hypothetical protein